MRKGFKPLLGAMIGLSVLVTSLARAYEGLADVSGPRHFIFMVHGIGGDKTTFNQLPNVLETTLKRIDDGMLADLNKTDTIYKTFPLEYTTKNDENSVYDFAKQIDKQMAKIIEASGGLKPADKISFIVHSQGGLVTSIWLFATAGKSTKLGLHNEYFPHVRSFITLGTPFWGSRLGNAGFIADYTTSLLSGLGKNQLADMSFESNAIELMRTYALNAKGRNGNQGQLEKMFKQIYMVNVAGNQVKIDSLDLESDGAVSVYSARMDFLHGEIKSGYDSDVLQKPKFGRLFENLPKSPDYVIVEALHSQPRMDEKHSRPTKEGLVSGYLYRTGNPSVHQVANDCMDKFVVENNKLAFNKESDCASPSFKYIVGNVLGFQNFYDKTELRKTDSYWIDIALKSTSAKATFIPDSMTVEVIDAAGGTLHTSIVDKLQAFTKGVGAYLEKIGEKYDVDMISSLGEKFQDTAKKDVNEDGTRMRQVLLGTTKDKYDENRPANDGFPERQVQIRISAPGFKPVKTFVTVKPSFTTFLKVNMDPVDQQLETLANSDE